MAAAAERESDSAEPPGSETLLDEVLRTLYDLGELGSREEAAEDSRSHSSRGRTAGYPEPARVTRSPGAVPARLTPAAPPSLRPSHPHLGRPFALSLCGKEKSKRVTEDRQLSGTLAKGQTLAG